MIASLESETQKSKTEIEPQKEMKRELIKLTREIVEKDQIISQIKTKLQVAQGRVDSKRNLMRSIQKR